MGLRHLASSGAPTLNGEVFAALSYCGARRTHMHYRSSITLLGLPLVHIAIGRAPGSQAVRGIAKGWIAIGDVAFGAVAFGGLAVGALSVGGLSGGALAVGGASVGIWSIGGVAFALFAVGGAAFGLIGATGGLAIAIEYAIGGLAVASHANDDVARSYFASGGFFRYTDAVAQYFEWLVGAAVGIGALTWAFGRSKNERDGAAGS